jgi:hypothetical protein
VAKREKDEEESGDRAGVMSDGDDEGEEKGEEHVRRCR